MEVQLRSSAHGPQMCGTPSRVTVRASTMEPAWGRRTDSCQHAGDTEGMAGRSPPPRKQRGEGRRTGAALKPPPLPPPEVSAQKTAHLGQLRRGRRRADRAMGKGCARDWAPLLRSGAYSPQLPLSIRHALTYVPPCTRSSHGRQQTTQMRGQSRPQRFTIHPFGISLKRQTGGAEQSRGLGGGEGWFCISFAVTVPGIHL